MQAAIQNKHTHLSSLSNNEITIHTTKEPIPPPVASTNTTITTTETKNDQGYVISSAQKKGAGCLRIYSILLIIFSILSRILFILMFFLMFPDHNSISLMFPDHNSISPGNSMMIHIPIDTIISIIAASLVLHLTTATKIEQIPLAKPNDCCGFRYVYALSITAAVLNAIIGFFQFVILYAMIRHYSRLIFLFEIFFGLEDSINRPLYVFVFVLSITFIILSVTFASLMAEYCAPSYITTSLVPANQVLCANAIPEKPKRRCCDCFNCCNGKCGCIICIVATVSCICLFSGIIYEDFFWKQETYVNE